MTKEYVTYNKAGNVLWRNIEARSPDHCRRTEALNITYYKWMFVALGILHAMRMRRIILPSVACPGLPFFFTLSLMCSCVYLMCSCVYLMCSCIYLMCSCIYLMCSCVYLMCSCVYLMCSYISNVFMCISNVFMYIHNVFMCISNVFMCSCCATCILLFLRFRIFWLPF